MNSPVPDFNRPWFNSRTAAAYVPCKSVKAFYEWCRRHFIVRRSNGSVAKADLDRALKAKRPRRVMNPNSLANLRTHRVSRHEPMMHDTSASSILPNAKAAQC